MKETEVRRNIITLGLLLEFLLGFPTAFIALGRVFHLHEINLARRRVEIPLTCKSTDVNNRIVDWNWSRQDELGGALGSKVLFSIKFRCVIFDRDVV